VTTLSFVGRESKLDIATHYGLDRPGIESWWRWDFPYPSRLVMGPTQPPPLYECRVFPWGKAAGA